MGSPRAHRLILQDHGKAPNNLRIHFQARGLYSRAKSWKIMNFRFFELNVENRGSREEIWWHFSSACHALFPERTAGTFPTQERLEHVISRLKSWLNFCTFCGRARLKHNFLTAPKPPVFKSWILMVSWRSVTVFQLLSNFFNTYSLCRTMVSGWNSRHGIAPRSIDDTRILFFYCIQTPKHSITDGYKWK